jgi:hypothetical protein
MDYILRDGIVFLFALYISTRFLFRCWNRWMRHLNIKAHGWPPAHLDADGDPVE